jgi:carboxylate-amine ligase
MSMNLPTRQGPAPAPPSAVPRPVAHGAPQASPGAFRVFGLELEYMIVDAATLDVRPLADRILQAQAGAQDVVDEIRRGPLAWSNELVMHVLELKNAQPLADLERVARGFEDEVRQMNRALLAHGARLMPGAMHPWMDPATETHLWPHGNRAIYRAYDRIFGCKGHGWSNLQSMHVNLPFADDREFERLHAAVRLVLPILPALAASSPFAQGRVPGPLDYRMEVYRHNQRRVPSVTGRVIPESFTSRRDYEMRLLDPMYADIAPLDRTGVLQQEWLNSHGAIARFDRNAIEIRVMDIQECPRADVALAALAIDLVQALYRDRFVPLGVQQVLETEPLAATLEACIMHGERAVIEHPPYLQLFDVHDTHCTAAELWRHLGAVLLADGAFHAPLWRDSLDLFLDQGPLARRLLSAAGVNPTRARLQAVFDKLCDCLEQGRHFEA